MPPPESRASIITARTKLLERKHEELGREIDR